jgi:hypothetical protein
MQIRFSMYALMDFKARKEREKKSVNTTEREGVLP